MLFFFFLNLFLLYLSRHSPRPQMPRIGGAPGLVRRVAAALLVLVATDA